MKTYLVGGAVRDRLLGLPVKDRDWVVVGATPEEMVARGFKPVGGDFPVFLHPETSEEYALARTERKTAPGYGGFVFHADPNITLEEDLARRDLTINAIAMGDDGTVVDPYNGRADLDAKVFRHASEAFLEDPVRILRVARFSARLPDFTIAPETMRLMTAIVKSGEVDALVSERVWKEISRGLMEVKPSRMFEVLRECGALAKIMPEIDCFDGIPAGPVDHHPEVDQFVHAMMVVDQSARLGYALPVRFAALCHDLGKGLTDPALWPKHHQHEIRGVKLVERVCERWKVPADMKSTAKLVSREHGNVHASLGLSPAGTLRLLDRCDAVRRPQRFEEILRACECDARGRLGLEDRAYPQPQRLRQALGFVQAAKTADLAKRLAAQKVKGEDIGHAIDLERVRAIKVGFERLAEPSNPEAAAKKERRALNGKVRQKIKHLRHVLQNNGKPHTDEVTARVALVREALHAALEERAYASQPKKASRRAAP